MKILILLLLLNFVLINAKYTFYVDINSDCTSGCGSIDKAFKNIKDAVTFSMSKTSYWDCSTIIIKPGIYKGNKNKDIFINEAIEIKSSSSNVSSVTIDCENTSGGFIISNAKEFTLEGITIKNCNSQYGGAIYLDSTDSILKNNVFDSNRAVLGGAIYSNFRTLNVIGGSFLNNTSLRGGGGIYITSSISSKFTGVNFQCNTNNGINRNEITCEKSNPIEIDKTSNITNSGFQCSKSCNIISSLTKKSLCLNPSMLCPKSSSSGNSTTTPPPLPSEGEGGSTIPSATCSIIDYGNINNSFLIGDGICNVLFENCLNSPNDCKSCYFSGIVLESYKTSDISDIDEITNQSNYVGVENTPFDIKSFQSDVKSGLVYGKIFGYLRVPITGQYKFIVTGSNIGVSLSINTIPMIDSYFQQYKLNSSEVFLLESKKVHVITGELISYATSSDIRSLRVLVYSPNGELIEPFFYSKNICGDGINDESENCLADLVSMDSVLSGTSQDPCKSTDPNEDFQNCYSRLTQTCATRTIAPGHLSPGFKLNNKDTLGNLISNQFIWSLPGSEHMSFGVDIVTAEEGKSPIFYLKNCDSIGSTLVEDVYRGKVYDVPRELFAKPFPQCTFSTESKFYSSSREISKAMMEATTESEEAGGGITTGFIDAQVKVAFSKERSVEESVKLTQSAESKFITTELQCTTSVMEINDASISFHPLFLKSLNEADDIDKMYDLIIRYGTHYYKKAIFGGKLKQIASSQEVSSDTESVSEWKESSKRAFGGGIKTSFFNARADRAETKDSSLSQSKHASYQSKSQYSSIISVGGTLGSYGPGSSMEDTNFERWGESVDTLPVPIDYSLEPIRSIISKQWKVKGTDKSIYDLWLEAEYIYYLNNQRDVSGNDDSIEYKLIIHATQLCFFDCQPIKPFLPTMYIKWSYIDAISKQEIITETKVTIPYVIEKKSGAKTQDFIFDFTYQPWTHYSAQNYKDNHIADEYSTPVTFSYENPVGFIHPFYMYHFKGPNFFNSVRRPSIRFENSQFFLYDDVQIISLETSNGIIFDKDTLLATNDNQFFSTFAYETFYDNDFPFLAYIPVNIGQGIEIPFLVSKSLQCPGNLKDASNIVCAFKLMYEVDYPSETFSFIYGDASMDYGKTMQDTNNLVYYFGKLRGTHSPDNFDVRIKNIQIGSNVRTNWILTLKTNTASWIRDLVVYSAAGDTDNINKYTGFLSPKITYELKSNLILNYDNRYFYGPTYRIDYDSNRSERYEFTLN